MKLTPTTDRLQTRMLNLIYAENKNGIIGSNGSIPWIIPEELEYFKIVTMGSAIIMGRKTWESLPKKPLPHRHNVVISSADIDSFTVKPHLVAPSLGGALTLVSSYRIFIIGGEKLLRESLPLASYVYRTIVDDYSEGDTKSPQLVDEDFMIAHKQNRKSSNGINYTTQILKRVNP